MATNSLKGAMVIAEVAQAHDGSLGMAHAFIDAIAKTGADAVKFQTHIAAAESTPAEPWRVAFSWQDKSRFDYWKRMEFTEEQWRGLREHAQHQHLQFLSSPFSLEAVDLLTRVEVSAWKVASGEIANGPMLDRMAATRLPILLSTGMSPLAEIDSAVNRVRSYGLSLTVMQCTSEYPCPPEKIGLNLLQFFRERYACAVGLSDHSGTIFAGLAAAALGAEVVEVHVTMSREAFGPDVAASVTTGELHQLVQGVRFIQSARGHPVDKDGISTEMAALRPQFTKSLVAKMDLSVGKRLVTEDFAFKKPGIGIPVRRLGEFVGRRMRRDVPAGQILQEDDFE